MFCSTLQAGARCLSADSAQGIQLPIRGIWCTEWRSQDLLRRGGASREATTSNHGRSACYSRAEGLRKTYRPLAGHSGRHAW
jgi:hypothetical protein